MKAAFCSTADSFSSAVSHWRTMATATMSRRHSTTSPVTGEEYTALRQLLPYPGLLPSEEPFTAADEAVRTDYPEVYSLVAAAGDVGIYTDPSQIPEEKRRSAALAAVPDTYRCQQDPAAWPEYPAEDSFLDVLFAAVDDTQLTPREWVDAAVRTIWGDAGAVTHGDTGQMTYHPTEGVLHTASHGRRDRYAAPLLLGIGNRKRLHR